MSSAEGAHDIPDEMHLENSRHCWIPPGSAPVAVQGRQLPDGMFYVGAAMPKLRGWDHDPDPCLINPRLTVGGLRAGMSYWPSYSTISGGDREAYLRWLSGGRKDRFIDIGYVFLFFYGLERRVVFDAVAGESSREELGLMLAEVERLRSIYAEDSGSFDGYSQGLCSVLRGLMYGGDPDSLLPSATSVNRRGFGGNGLVFALCALASAGRSLDATWAFQWYLSMDPRLKTAATRCPDLFEAAFTFRFSERYPEGLALEANDRPVRLRYGPASSGFGRGQAEQIPVPGIKDVDLGRHKGKVKRVGDEAQELISGYSRRIGAGAKENDPWALVELPLGLALERLEGGFGTWMSALRTRLEDGSPAAFPLTALHGFFPPASPPAYRKSEIKKLAFFFKSGGIAMEPDPALGGANPSTTGFWVAFPYKKSRTPEVSPEFDATTTVLHLASAVAHADGVVDENEVKVLEEHIKSGLKLPAAQKRRLDAHVVWLRKAVPKLTGLKNRLATLSLESRQGIARLVLSVAAADGRISPAEVRSITKIYELLGIPESELHQQLHGLTSSPPPAGSPVRIQHGSPVREFSIPSPQLPKAEPGPDIILDASRLAKLREETDDVYRILKTVFEENGEEPDEPPDRSESVEMEVAESVETELEEEDGREFDIVRILDDDHAAALEILLARSRWEEDELSTALGETGLMCGGAIEVINEAAIDLVGEPLFLWEEEIEMNPHVREELGL